MSASTAMPGRDRVAPASRNRMALVAIALAAIATAAVSLTTVNTLKDTAIAASRAGLPLTVARLQAAVGAGDLLLGMVAALCLAALVLIELRGRSISRLLATATEGQAFVLLTILTAWFGHSYLNPGVLLGGDTGTHISRFLEVQRGLDDGELALWTNYQYAGAPLLWFTGPLTYVVGGFVAFIVRDAVLATKIVLFTLHMLSGWLFFAMLRRLGIRPVAAMLAAAGFAGSFAHLHLFLYRGVIPQAFTIVFLVLLFYASDGLLRGRGQRWANVSIFALSTAGMILNHQPHALFAAVYLALFGGLALLHGFWRWGQVPLLVAAGVLGVIASLVAVVPVLSEADWVMIEPEGAMFGLHLPTLARLADLVTWRNTRTTWGIDYWAYLGLGMIGFGAAGMVGGALGRLRGVSAGAIALPTAACLALCLVLFNPVVRDILFLLFFLGLFAALGLDWLMDRRLLTGRWLLLAVLAIVVDLASTSVQPVARIDKAFMVDAGKLLERVAPNQRVMQIGVAPDGTLDADMGPDNGPQSYYAVVQRIAGNHNMAATRLHNFLTSTAKLAEAELQATSTLTPQTRDLLGLFNVGRIVCSTSFDNGCPAGFQHTATEPVLGRTLPLVASPVLFSRSLTTLALPDGEDKPMLWPWNYADSSSRGHVAQIDATLRDFLSAETIDLAARTAQTIAIRNAGSAQVGHQVATQVAVTPVASGSWVPHLIDYQVRLDRVTIRVTTDSAGFVQLAHPWFPSTRVMVNGRAVQALRGTIDLIVVPIAVGDSVITLQDGWTPIRRISAWASLLGMALIGGLTSVLARRDGAVGLG